MTKQLIVGLALGGAIGDELARVYRYGINIFDLSLLALYIIGVYCYVYNIGAKNV